MCTPTLRGWLAWLVAFLPALLIAQVTETPFTVAPGSVLVEMDGLRLSVDRDGGSRYTGIAVASTLLSAGITSSLDVQAGVDVFLKETFRVGGSRDPQSGLGDLSFRMKWTVWRDEKRGAALAAIPYVKIPSGTSSVGSDAIEGGVILPWAMKFATGAIVGAMFQWDLVRNDAENGYDGHWHATGYIEQQIVGGFAVYAEAVVVATSDGLSKTTSTIGVGGACTLPNEWSSITNCSEESTVARTTGRTFSGELGMVEDQRGAQPSYFGMGLAKGSKATKEKQIKGPSLPSFPSRDHPAPLRLKVESVVLNELVLRK